MATTSFARSVASGSTDTFTVPFQYLDKAHVRVLLDGVAVDDTTYTWPTDGTIQFIAGPPIPGTMVERRRQTPTDPLVNFTAGNLDPNDINTADRQALYLAQEADDDAADILVRSWFTKELAAGGFIEKGTTGDVAVFDADGNITPKALAALVGEDLAVIAVTGSYNDLVDVPTEFPINPADQTKLDSVEVGATANDTDANLKNRANHTGEQAISTVTGLQAELDGKQPALGYTAVQTVNGKAGQNITLVIGDLSGLQAALDSKQAALGFTPENAANKGIANGFAGLGPDGKVPSAQLPVNGSYKGSWNASTNSPTIVSGVGVNGDAYTVTVAGSTNIDGTSTWAVGDQIKFNGTVWQKIPNTNAVTSVAGKVGAVTLIIADIASLQAALDGKQNALGFTPVQSVAGKTGVVSLVVGDITGLQAALDAKQASLGFTPVNKAGDTMSGGLTLAGILTSPELRLNTSGVVWRLVRGGSNELVLQASTDGFVSNFVDGLLISSSGAVSIPAGLTVGGGVVSTKSVLLTSGTDLDTVTNASDYQITNPGNGPPSMTSALAWYLEVKRGNTDANAVMQRMVVMTGDNQTSSGAWVRFRKSGTWHPWHPEGGWATPESIGGRTTTGVDCRVALALCLRSGFGVLLTGGYRIDTSSIVFGYNQGNPGNGSVIIQGQGLRHILNNHAGDALLFALNTPTQFQNTSTFLIMRDVCIAANVLSNGSGLAITGGGGSGSTHKSVELRNVRIEGVSTSTAFTSGFYFNNARNCVIDGCSVYGQQNQAAGARTRNGFVYEGDSDPVDSGFVNCHAYFCASGIMTQGTCEGISIDKFTAVGCDRGISASWDENPVSGDNAGKPLLRVFNSHMNCFAYGIYMDRVRDYVIIGNDFLCETANSNYNCIRNSQASSASEYGWIDGNRMQDAHGLSSGTTVGINLNGFSSGVLDSRIGVNRYISLKIGLNLGANAKNVRYSGASLYAGVTTSVNNLGGGTNTAY